MIYLNCAAFGGGTKVKIPLCSREIAYLLEANMQAAELCSPAVEITFSDVFLLDHLRTQTDLFLPWMMHVFNDVRKIMWFFEDHFFLYAMAGIDFGAEKLYGSVWQLRPRTTLNLRHGMRFHPHGSHPNTEIPYRIARRFGRRLNRAYGWTGDTFRLREKGEEVGSVTVTGE
jgi:hypothetical protein